MGGDQAIVDAARVSYGAGTRKVSEDRGLIRYLKRHKHTTPLEMVEFKFHISMPIFIARQWIRHRTANVNEYSGRYSKMPMMFYTPKQEDLGLQSSGNRQGRDKITDESKYQEFIGGLFNGRDVIKDHYKWSLEQDIARELARIDLPLSTYTQWYWKIDLHNLFHFLTLRCDSHAQKEIHDYADIMAGMVRRVCPLAYEAWFDYDLQGSHFSRGEMDNIRDLINIEDGKLTPNPEGSSHKVSWDRNLSKREAQELLNKFSEQEDCIPHNLDLSVVKDPEFFERQWNAHSEG